MQKVKCAICKQACEPGEKGTVLRRGEAPGDYCGDCIEKRSLWCRRCERKYDAAWCSNRDCPRCNERGEYI